MKQSNDLELKHVDQRYDGFEAWLRFKESDWIRLDAFLEYYLSQNVDHTKEYKEKLGDKSVDKQYQNKLFDMFSEKTSGGKEFDFEKYLSWVNNPSEISEVLELLKS
ncbi:MAG: hypothetical protein GY816_01405 [Cytophagales bacterium]|nr:hypothetical protein [Cytophagales bacterium]